MHCASLRSYRTRNMLSCTKSEYRACSQTTSRFMLGCSAHQPPAAENGKNAIPLKTNAMNPNHSNPIYISITTTAWNSNQNHYYTFVRPSRALNRLSQPMPDCSPYTKNTSATPNNPNAITTHLQKTQNCSQCPIALRHQTHFAASINARMEKGQNYKQIQQTSLHAQQRSKPLTENSCHKRS